MIQKITVSILISSLLEKIKNSFLIQTLLPKMILLNLSLSKIVTKMMKSWQKSQCKTIKLYKRRK